MNGGNHQRGLGQRPLPLMFLLLSRVSTNSAAETHRSPIDINTEIKPRSMNMAAF